MPRERRLFAEGYGKMRLEAVSGMLLTLLLIGMLSASFEIREASADPTVRIYVEMPPRGYIPGIPVGQTLKVAVNIESPPEWKDTANGIVGWGFYVHVNPDVLEPITVESATSGYFLYDFADEHGYSTSILFLTDKEAGLFEDVAEFIMGYELLGVGAGGDGKLCELWFKSKSETASTSIDLIDVRYWAVLSGGWLPVDVVIDGHYNARTYVANNVLCRSTTSHGGMGGGSPASTVQVGNYYGWDGITHCFNTDMRFEVDIPQGARINDARLVFTATDADKYSSSPSSNGQTGVNTRIYGEDVDNAPSPSTTYRWVSEKINYRRYWHYDVEKTSEFVDWDDIEPWYTDNVYYSPNISNIIQEIVDRPGWSPGNNLTIMWEEHDSSEIMESYVFRQAYGYDQGDKTVKLEVTFEE